MSSRAENQLTFAVGGDRFRVPKRIHDFRGGQEIVDFCSQREAWKQPRGRVLFKDLGEDGPFSSVNPNTWQVEEEVDPAMIKRKKDMYTGAIIITPSLSDETAWLAAGPISESVSILRLESPVIVVETKGDGFDEKSGKGLREAVLKKAGLVERRILTSVLDNFLVWQGRLRKKVKRKPVNLIASDRPFEKLEILRFYWRGMREDYRKGGFEIENEKESEILERLRNSKMPLHDIQRLKLGFGVKVIEVDTGRRWKVNLEGVWDEILPYGRDDEEHEEEDYAPPLKRKKKAAYVSGRTEAREICFDCGARWFYDMCLVKNLPKKRKKIRIDTGCPSCGLKYSTDLVISEDQWQSD